MTNFNKTFGEFAEDYRDFMVMNRNYERDEEDDSLISDLSTYIDPSKYNQIFADTSLSAQNFWVQTAVQMEVGRNISAKQIPNLQEYEKNIYHFNQDNIYMIIGLYLHKEKE